MLVHAGVATSAILTTVFKLLSDIALATPYAPPTSVTPNTTTLPRCTTTPEVQSGQPNLPATRAEPPDSSDFNPNPDLNLNSSSNFNPNLNLSANSAHTAAAEVGAKRLAALLLAALRLGELLATEGGLRGIDKATGGTSKAKVFMLWRLGFRV